MIGIKDMKMPSCCIECRFYEIGQQTDAFYSRCKIDDTYFPINFKWSKRHVDCPLIEIKETK